MNAFFGEFGIDRDELTCNLCEEPVADIRNENLLDLIEYAEDHWNEQHGGAS